MLLLIMFTDIRHLLRNFWNDLNNPCMKVVVFSRRWEICYLHDCTYVRLTYFFIEVKRRSSCFFLEARRLHSKFISSINKQYRKLISSSCQYLSISRQKSSKVFYLSKALQISKNYYPESFLIREHDCPLSIFLSYHILCELCLFGIFT